MSVRSAKDAIREARLTAGLTQEQMSEGICTVQALSRIETGAAGVSPATFQALMTRAGAPCECYPIFADRSDFECYYALKQSGFHLDSRQLSPAYDALQKAADLGWADNKLYYQEWLMLHCRLQSYSYHQDHDRIYQSLLFALRISHPRFDLSDFRNILLTQNEIRLLIAISQEALYLEQHQVCLQIHSQVTDYLSASKLSELERERLLTEDAIVYTKYLLTQKDYSSALYLASSRKQNPSIRWLTYLYLELSFLIGLCQYRLGNKADAEINLKAAYYSAHAIGSSYADLCRDYLQNQTDFELTSYMSAMPSIDRSSYPMPTVMDTSRLSNGVYNADAVDTYTLGSLIHDLRTEQKLSQTILCHGLCSTSKLSKIENNTIQPSISLTEALLQRLGVTERIFTFWGDEREAKFHALKFALIKAQSAVGVDGTSYLKEMEALLTEKDILYRQEYFTAKSGADLSPAEHIYWLKEALKCTFPDFDIYRIVNYRLTWAELSIINSLINAYRQAGDYESANSYYWGITEYLKRTPRDSMLQAQVLPNTILAGCLNLYSQKNYELLLKLAESSNFTLVKYNIIAYTVFLFYYSQSLGECGYYDRIVLPAAYSCNLSQLLGFSKNSQTLKNCLSRDFAILLDY